MNIKNICTLFVTLGLFYSSLFRADVYAANDACFGVNISGSNSLSSEIAVPLKNDVGWRYKIVDGVIYKRLYDYTNQRWIGKWIKA